MAWRLGLDVGTNSIGWAAVELMDGRPCGLIDAGVRIFSDGRIPKGASNGGASLAVQRREPRSARRNRDRYLKRRSEFMDRLVEHGLMPREDSERKALENLDPWILRARGLDEKLSLHELGRALFHLQQRRGFKSNRKTDRGDSDKGAIAEATQRTRERLEEEGKRTLGQLLGRPRMEWAARNAGLPAGQREPQPATRVSPYRSKTKTAYDYYPTRALIRDEFDCLWARQREFHGDALSEKARAALADTLFFQRKLKPQPVGKCTLDPAQERAPKALPSVQRQRIYQDANHLAIRRLDRGTEPLSREQRDKVVARLLSTGKVTFDSLRKTVLKLPGDVRFNLESEKRKELKGDETAAILAKGKGPKHPALWGEGWRDLPLPTQDAIVEILLGLEPEAKNSATSVLRTRTAVIDRVSQALDISAQEATKLLEDEDGKQVADWLDKRFALGAETARAIVDAPLPDGHSAFCRDVTGKLLAELERDVITYDKAVERAGYPSHSRLDHDGEVLDRLPYYGEVLGRHVAFGTGEPADPPEKRFGKIANPTVHVALNQIRKVVNALVARFGAPDEIVVELARDLPLSGQGRRDLERRQKENQDANDKRRTELENLGEQDNYQNRLRLRLWEELNPSDILDRRCPFTGEQISIKRLFSDEVEIEHILPRSRTLDDSPANKTLSMRRANRQKREQSPWEAFGHSPDGYDWDNIAARAANMPPNKAWRFAPDAMERFESEERDFMARQLHSTQYTARLAANYLVWLIGDPGKLCVTPGRLTSDLRHHWGLNSILAGHNLGEARADDIKKNRNDHRHHAIDAVVTALTDRSLLQRIAMEAGKAEHAGDSRLIHDLDDPWPGFRDRVMEVVSRIVVSHKPDHGVQGALHEETAYAQVRDPETGEPRLASRKSLVDLERSEISKIGDLKIRDDLLERTAGASDSVMKRMLQEYCEETGVKRVRIHKVVASFRKIHHGKGHEKAVVPGENYCVDIFEGDDGVWRGVGISVFDANQVRGDQRPHPVSSKRRHVMRVHKNDILTMTIDGVERLMLVVVLEVAANRFWLAPVTAAGDLNKQYRAGAKIRKEIKARKGRPDPTVEEDDSDITTWPLERLENENRNSFRWVLASYAKLRECGAQLVHVDPTGRCFRIPHGEP